MKTITVITQKLDGHTCAHLLFTAPLTNNSDINIFIRYLSF